MSLRINSEAPNFTAQTTQGRMDFHQWIGSGAEHCAHLGHAFNLIKYVHRKSITKHHSENVAGADCAGCYNCRGFQLGIGASMAYQAGPGCLTKSYAEFDSRDSLYQCLVEVLNGLDEVRLSDNDVEVRIGFCDFH